jgi:hypothetical protein
MLISKNIYYLFLGDSLILFAQIITAAQMVYEEKYVVTNDIPPLQAVGWEGTNDYPCLNNCLKV